MCARFDFGIFTEARTITIDVKLNAVVGFKCGFMGNRSGVAKFFSLSNSNSRAFNTLPK